MDDSIKRRTAYGYVLYPSTVALLIYMFGYQFAYPFPATVFLYLAFGGWCVFLGLTKKLPLTWQAGLLSTIAVYSLIESLRLGSPPEGRREALLLLVMSAFVFVASQNDRYVARLKQILFGVSLVVVGGVLLQYLIPDSFNALMRRLMNANSWDIATRVYSSGAGGRAGFFANTPDAAYFSALAGGFCLLNLLDKNSKRKYWLANVAVVLLSFLAIALTSKRGMFIAFFVAFLTVYAVWKKITVGSVILFAVFASAIVGSFLYLAAANEGVAYFMTRFDAAASRSGDFTTGRLDIWNAAFHGFDNWFVGRGAGATYETPFGEHGMHNVYLQIIYDYGIVGLFLYACFFGVNLRNAIRGGDYRSLFLQVVLLTYGMSGNPIYSFSFFATYNVFARQVAGDDRRQLRRDRVKSAKEEMARRFTANATRRFASKI